MKVVTINIDTKQFKYNVNYNPSIVNIQDDLFLLSFSTFRRNKNFGLVLPTIDNPYHPWYGGPESNTWWNKGVDGIWGTGFVLLKFIKNNFIIEEVKNNSVYSNNNVSYGNDMRLLKINQFIFSTFNLQASSYANWGKDRVKYGLPKAQCKEDCFAMQVVLKEVKYWNQYIVNDFSETMVLCPKLQDSDKNWSSFLRDDGEIFCSDYLTPKHTLIHVDTCKIIQEKSINQFENIEIFYNNRGVLFSLSTPALQFGNLKLGVGHIKITPKYLDDDTKAFQFVKHHPLPKHVFYNRLYMMFFYTFDPYTFEIVSFSSAFYPPNTNHSVVFPTGLTYYHGQYIISYGEADMAIKLLFISPNDIQDMLQNQFSDEYNFIYL